MKINEKYLTVRWNNLLTVGLGLPTLIYVGIVLATASVSTATFIGLAVLGALY